MACRFLVLIKRVGVDIQRGRRLAVSEQSSNRTDIRAAGDEQACRRVAQAVDVQIGWKIVCFQNFLESPCEGRRCHRQLHALSAEHIVILGLLTPVVALHFRCAEGFVFAEQALHFGGEVHIAVARFRFRSLYDDLVTGRADFSQRRTQKEKCENGEISMDEFTQWLKR